ncbi:MAG: hypothetical protein Kow00127_06120 [Bacteroidales bacterium]
MIFPALTYRRKQYILTALLILFAGLLKGFGQYKISDTLLSIPMFHAGYAFQVPGGDMADRFGANSVIAGGFTHKTPTNWLFGGEFNFIFGGIIRNESELLSNLKTEQGYIIDNAGSFGFVSLYERGYYLTAKAGKVIPAFHSNPNSGIMLTGGVGYLQHKIRIEVADNNVPQLAGDYKRGYDRLATGFCVNLFAGYLYLSNSRLLNFYGGFEANLGFTKPARDINFDTRQPDPVSNRFDPLFGIRVGWIVPVFRREPEPFYYY